MDPYDDRPANNDFLAITFIRVINHSASTVPNPTEDGAQVAAAVNLGEASLYRHISLLR
jgi:hypothetical protein